MKVNILNVFNVSKRETYDMLKICVNNVFELYRGITNSD